MDTTKNIPTVTHNGQTFLALDPADIDTEAMSFVQKIKDVYAWQVPEGETHTVITYAHGMVETTNTAKAGDWIVYNIGNSEGRTLEEKLKNCDRKVIKAEHFAKLYKTKETSDEEDDTSDKRGTLFEYIGAPIQIARVPFPFYLAAPWGEEQFLQAGSYIVYNPNTREWYGTAGARNRKAGQLENTYALTDDDPRTISKQFRMVIASDRSPLPGVQFSMADVARAYEKAGLELGKLSHYL